MPGSTIQGLDKLYTESFPTPPKLPHVGCRPPANVDQAASIGCTPARVVYCFWIPSPDLFPSLFYGISVEKRKINFQKPPAGYIPEEGCDMRRIMLSFYRALAKSTSEQNNKCYLASYSIIFYA